MTVFFIIKNTEKSRKKINPGSKVMCRHWHYVLHDKLNEMGQKVVVQVGDKKINNHLQGNTDSQQLLSS